MAGTFVIRGMTQVQYGSGPWLQSGTENEVEVPPSLASQAVMIVALGGDASIYLDGSVTPTAYEDLPEDFGISAITYRTLSWIINDIAGVEDVQQFHNPLHQDGDVNFFLGQIGQFYWTWQGMNLWNYKLVGGPTDESLLFDDPYTAGSVPPPVPTKWNGWIQNLLNSSILTFTWTVTPNEITAYNAYLHVRILFFQDPEFFEIWGTYDSYPPPPNIIYTMVGGVDLGGSAVFHLLSDASGIYTLVEGQYHDELYQRVGTTGSTTITVSIPMPFFKTGYIGGS